VQILGFTSGNCDSLQILEVVQLDRCFYNGTVSYDEQTNTFVSYEYSTDDCSGPAIPGKNMSVPADQCVQEEDSSYIAVPLEENYDPIFGLFTYQVWTGRDESACDQNAEVILIQYFGDCSTYSVNNVTLSTKIECNDNGTATRYECTDAACGECTSELSPPVYCEEAGDDYVSLFCPAFPTSAPTESSINIVNTNNKIDMMKNHPALKGLRSAEKNVVVRSEGFFSKFSA